jgi:hypothetical protein
MPVAVRDITGEMTQTGHSVPHELCNAANTAGLELLVLFSCLGRTGRDE